MSGEVQVRIRHADEARSVPLTTWQLDDLDVLRRHIKYWGVYDDTGDSDSEPACQFVIDDDCAYFEVVIGGE